MNSDSMLKFRGLFADVSTMNRLSVSSARRRVRRLLFVSSVPLAVMASVSHASVVRAQDQNATADTIATQFPAVPHTIPPVRLSPTIPLETPSTVPGDGALALRTGGAGNPASVRGQDNSGGPAGLAETGAMSTDVLFASLTMLTLGAGFILGVTPTDD
jgi:hypothetical protein